MKSKEITEDAPKKKAGKTKRFFLWIAKSLLILIVLLFLASVVQNIIATKKLQKIEEKSVSAGIPITWADVEEMYSDIDPDRNGRSAFISALTKIKNLPELDEETDKNEPVIGRASLPSVGEPLPEEMLTAMTNVVAMSSDALDELNVAVSMKPLFFLQPTNALNLVNLDSIVQLRQASRLFSIKAIVKSELGVNDSAVEAVIDGINLRTALEPDPYMITSLIRFASMGITYNGLERVLSADGINKAHLNALEDALSHQPESAKQSLIGETVWLRSVYESMQNSEREKRQFMEFQLGDDVDVFMLLSHSKGWMRMHEAYCINQIHEFSEIWDNPWNEFLEENDKIMTAIPRLYNINAWGDVFSLLKLRELRAVGYWDCARIAVALKKYLMENANPPATLDELSPKYMKSVPKEPFLGKDYFYNIDDNIVTISFLQPNRKEPTSFKLKISDDPQPEAIK